MGLDALGLDLLFRSSADNSGSEKAAAGVKHVGEAAHSTKEELEELGYSAKAAKGMLLELVAFAEIVAQFKEGAKEVMLLEQAFNELDRSTKRYKQDGVEVKEGIESFAKKLAEVAGVQDEKSIPAMVRLYSATGDLELAQKRAALAADIAIARDIDFSDAMGVVSMAAGGNIRSLREVGIFMQSTGDKTKDAQIALDALVGRFGGAADGAKGLKVDLARLNAEFEDVRGKAVEPLLHLLVVLMKSGKTAFNTLAEGALKLGATFGYVYDQAGNLGSLLKDLFMGNFSKIEKDMAAFKGTYKNYQKDYELITKVSEDELLKIWEGTAQQKLGIDRKQRAGHIEGGKEAAKQEKDYLAERLQAEVTAAQTSIARELAERALLAHQEAKEMEDEVGKVAKTEEDKENIRAKYRNLRFASEMKALNALLKLEDDETKRVIADTEKKMAAEQKANEWVLKETVRIDQMKLKGANDYMAKYRLGLQNLADNEKKLLADAVKAGVSAEQAKELATRQRLIGTYQLEKEKAKAEMDLNVSVFNALVSLSNTLFGESKALALAQTVINTAAGIMKIWATTDGYTAIAMTVVEAAAGVAAIAKITSTNYNSTATATNSTGTAPAPQGFDSPSNDYAAYVGGGNWARHMVQRFQSGATAGFSDGLMGMGRGHTVNSTTDNRRTFNVNLYGASFLDPSNMQHVTQLHRALTVVDRQLEQARVVGRTTR